MCDCFFLSLSVNTFIKEANSATLDITGDSEEMMNMKKRLMRWDKKKKKMVQVNPVCNFFLFIFFFSEL